MEHTVILNVYDLSNGIAKNLSGALLGQEFPAVYHSGVVVHGREFYYGGGIQYCAPNCSPYGTPIRVEVLGTTKRTLAEVTEEIARRLSHEFKDTNYDFIYHNCNHFSDSFAKYLGISNGIPSEIRDQGVEFSKTGLGKMILPFLGGAEVPQMFESNSTADKHVIAPEASPSSTATIGGKIKSPTIDRELDKLPQNVRKLREFIKEKYPNLEMRSPLVYSAKETQMVSGSEALSTKFISVYNSFKVANTFSDFYKKDLIPHVMNKEDIGLGTRLQTSLHERRAGDTATVANLSEALLEPLKAIIGNTKSSIEAKKMTQQDVTPDIKICVAALEFLSAFVMTEAGAESLKNYPELQPTGWGWFLNYLGFGTIDMILKNTEIKNIDDIIDAAQSSIKMIEELNKIDGRVTEALMRYFTDYIAQKPGMIDARRNTLFYIHIACNIFKLDEMVFRGSRVFSARLFYNLSRCLGHKYAQLPALKPYISQNNTIPISTGSSSIVTQKETKNIGTIEFDGESDNDEAEDSASNKASSKVILNNEPANLRSMDSITLYDTFLSLCTIIININALSYDSNPDPKTKAVPIMNMLSGAIGRVIILEKEYMVMEGESEKAFEDKITHLLSLMDFSILEGFDAPCLNELAELIKNPKTALSVY